MRRMFDPPVTRCASAARLADLVDELATLGTGLDEADDASRLAQLTELERVKAAAAAAQARLVAAPVDSGRGHRSMVAQVALARRTSPWQAARYVSAARRLVADLPATLAALTTGELSESRAAVVARETSCLTAADRRSVDREVCGDAAAVGRLGDRGVERAVRAAVCRRIPEGARARVRAAEKERRVGIRPLPDAMCRLSALLPLAQGVAAHAALTREADSVRASGDSRTRGQIAADVLVERVTGQARADRVPVEVQVVISDPALLTTGAGADDPAQLPGYGSVPAGWVRDLVEGAYGDADARVWLRRLYATPDRSQLVAMESTRRTFPPGLRRFLRTRDGTCRTPWCDAPIRHHDHVDDRCRGGPTSVDNGQGLCERCNYTKQLPGWQVRVVEQRAGPHTVRWTTPSGATYDSTAPPLLPGATPPPRLSAIETALGRGLVPEQPAAQVLDLARADHHDRQPGVEQRIDHRSVRAFGRDLACAVLASRPTSSRRPAHAVAAPDAGVHDPPRRSLDTWRHRARSLREQPSGRPARANAGCLGPMIANTRVPPHRQW